MKRKVMAPLMAALGAMVFSFPLLAHHGTAALDNDTRVTLKGTVTEWLWSNPHCLLQLDVKSDDGKIVHWIGETQNPVSMTNVGWSKSAIKAGDEVSVVMLPVKNGLPLGRLASITLPNGKTLISGEGLPREEREKLEHQVRDARP